MSVSRIPEPVGALQQGATLSGQLPTLTGGTLIAGAGVDVFGAYVQLLAAAGVEIYLTGLSVRAGHFNTGHAVVQIATGGPVPPEVNVYMTKAVFDLPAANTILPAVYQPIWPWVPIPSGARVASRVALGLAASNVLVTAHYVPAAAVFPA